MSFQRNYVFYVTLSFTPKVSWSVDTRWYYLVPTHCNSCRSKNNSMLGSISQSYIIIILAILLIFQPSGGSGMYMWSSSNTSVATVSTKGVVMTTSAVGYSLVRAADMKNPANFDTTEVGIIGPTECVFHLFVCTLALWQGKICILDQPLHIWYTIQYVYMWAILVGCGLKHKKWSSPGLCSSAKENGVYPCSCWGTGWLLHLASVGCGFLYLLRYFINK